MAEPPAREALAERLKRRVRVVRARPVLNHAVTGIARAALGRSTRSPDLLVRLLPREGVVEAPLPRGGALRLWSRADDEVASAVYWRGWSGHEPETARLFYELASSARTTVDVGAHVGYYALLAAHANPSGSVYAFEPMPSVHERLRRNVALNGLDNVSCLAAAAGDATRRADLFHANVAGALPSSSSLSRPFAHEAFGGRRLVSSSVPLVSLDDFLEERGLAGVDLVKIDVEGCESAVLRGMRRVLGRERPAIVCEVLSAEAGEQIEQVLRPLAYEFFVLTGAGPRRREHVRPDARWRNALFEHPRSATRTTSRPGGRR